MPNGKNKNEDIVNSTEDKLLVPSKREEQGKLPMPLEREEQVKSCKNRKRSIIQEIVANQEMNSLANEKDDMDNDIGNEMAKLLQTANNDMVNARIKKRQRLEHSTSKFAKINEVKLSEMWQKQRSAQTEIFKELQGKVETTLNCIEEEVVRFKDREFKMIKMLEQHITKQGKNYRALQEKHISELRQANEDFSKDMLENDAKDLEEFKMVQNYVHNELRALQKKMIDDEMKNGFAVMKKSLQNPMFNQW